MHLKMTIGLTGVVFPLTPGPNLVEDDFIERRYFQHEVGLKLEDNFFFFIIWLKSNLRVRCCKVVFKMCPIESTLCINCFSFSPLSIFPLS